MVYLVWSFSGISTMVDAMGIIKTTIIAAVMLDAHGHVTKILKPKDAVREPCENSLWAYRPNLVKLFLFY